jgi:hypothetical protein
MLAFSLGGGAESFEELAEPPRDRAVLVVDQPQARQQRPHVRDTGFRDARCDDQGRSLERRADVLGGYSKHWRFSG